MTNTRKELVARAMDIQMLRDGGSPLLEFALAGDSPPSEVGMRYATAAIAAYEASAPPDPRDAEIARLRETLEPFALISMEGIVKADAGYVTVTTCAEYFHRARAAHAARRGLSVNALARRIVEEAVDGDLVDAVLDDGGA